MDLEKDFIKHCEDNEKTFKHIDERLTAQDEVLGGQSEDHVEFKKSLDKIEEFMKNMEGVNDLIKGTKLLKTPSLWLLGLVIGLVALLGGFRTIINWFIFPK